MPSAGWGSRAPDAALAPHGQTVANLRSPHLKCISPWHLRCLLTGDESLAWSASPEKGEIHESGGARQSTSSPTTLGPSRGGMAVSGKMSATALHPATHRETGLSSRSDGD